MAKTNWQDPGSSEIRSTQVAGLQEAVGKIEDVLDMQVVSVTDASLNEVYISDADRYRIYQVADPSHRNWVASPAPVIKVNGTQITSGFEIDYAGGAVIFSPSLVATDVVTADFTCVKNQSVKIDTHLDETVQAHGDHDSQDVLLTRDAAGKLTGIDVKKPDDLGVSRITATLSFDASGRLSSVLEKELDTDGVTIKSQATATIIRDTGGRITELEVR